MSNTFTSITRNDEILSARLIDVQSHLVKRLVLRMNNCIVEFLRTSLQFSLLLDFAFIRLDLDDFCATTYRWPSKEVSPTLPHHALSMTAFSACYYVNYSSGQRLTGNNRLMGIILNKHTPIWLNVYLHTNILRPNTHGGCI